MATTLFLIFLFTAQAASGVLSATFTFKNNCPYPIWPATLANPDTGTPQLSTTGFRLNPGEPKDVEAIPKWSGRFWARTRCSEAGTACETADCGSGQVECNGRSGSTPSTLAELTLDGDNGQDTYDVSLIDGFNLPLSVAPQGGQGCRPTSCTADVNSMCPQDSSRKSGADTIACKGGCETFKDDVHCCREAYKDTCPPTEYSMMFKKICPDAYSYAKDDPSSTFRCRTGKEKDRTEKLPGQPAVEFTENGGYVTVDEKNNRAFYYYFAEAESLKKSKLLLIWLDGGPGCSSLAYSAMQELGPFRVHSDGKTLFWNPYAWNKVANFLFVETPAGVGFSYTNTTSDLA